MRLAAGIDSFDNFPLSYAYARSIGYFRAWCIRVVDGDTYDFIVDLGLTVRVRVRVRLSGLDTAEIFHPRNQLEKDHGVAAVAYIEPILLNQPCLIRTFKTASDVDVTTVGRYVADVEVWDAAAGDTKDVKTLLAAAGFAKHASY